MTLSLLYYPLKWAVDGIYAHFRAHFMQLAILDLCFKVLSPHSAPAPNNLHNSQMSNKRQPKLNMIFWLLQQLHLSLLSSAPTGKNELLLNSCDFHKHFL